MPIVPVLSCPVRFLNRNKSTYQYIKECPATLRVSHGQLIDAKLKVLKEKKEASKGT